MITASEVRNQFLDYFKSRQHKIVSSAPIVVKNDPTLMFTNAGMNQFKDYFLGNKHAKDHRVANTQKCLRVSGKHNDLEEVGVDTYHHTMFEMLGNWSFGDYFKQEAIEWAWDLLTRIYKLDEDRLYVTIFEGNEKDLLSADTEALEIWSKYIAPERILKFDKKDNFWEMGDTGPCGPCSEIHIDLRTEEERKKTDAATLVNKNHPQVIEIWNLVFIQFNRKANGTLDHLPEKHVDTGMGLERLVRAINIKHSNYDTDLFMDTIAELEKLSDIPYGDHLKSDIAFRVIADHLRAVAFTIADGQLPSNEKAGYVVRRILRRAIRYGYSFLKLEEPFMHKLLDGLATKFKTVFPELDQQKSFITKVILQEEKSFLNTLTKGLKLFDQYTKGGKKDLDGKSAFELYDTYGFPIDLCELLARENGITVDIKEFQQELSAQKERSRSDAKKESGDWQVILHDEKEEFVGYDFVEIDVKLTRYRQIQTKGKTRYHLVFNLSPFYAESGGQVGDIGTIEGIDDGDSIAISDTQKENDLIIHLSDKLPLNLQQTFRAKIDLKKRKLTANNHSATHLLQAALKKVLGDHVQQKGSLVNQDYLRFDFSHFQKVEKPQLEAIEALVNEKIRAAIPLEEARNVPYSEALNRGATALFGEKYGDVVRVITFEPGFSVELCGGTHVQNTANIGLFKIISESSVAAGVRRIEAITASRAEEYINQQLNLLEKISETLGQAQDISKSVETLMKENAELRQKITAFESAATHSIKNELLRSVQRVNGLNVLIAELDISSSDQVKDLAFQLKNELPDLFCVLLAKPENKPSITIIISDALAGSKNWNASQLVREWAKKIKGGGGGQAFFAQAGGSDASGLPEVKKLAEQFIAEN